MNLRKYQAELIEKARQAYRDHSRRWRKHSGVQELKLCILTHKEYNGRTYENIKSISATLFPNVKPSVSVGEQVFEEILSDGDVPF